MSNLKQPVLDDARVDVIIPTAPNVLLMVNENIVENLRKQQPADIQLLSLYKRAYLIVNETDEVGIVRQAGKGATSG